MISGVIACIWSITEILISLRVLIYLYLFWNYQKEFSFWEWWNPIGIKVDCLLQEMAIMIIFLLMLLGVYAVIIWCSHQTMRLLIDHGQNLYVKCSILKQFISHCSFIMFMESDKVIMHLVNRRFFLLLWLTYL